MLRSGLEVYGPRPLHASGARRETSCPRRPRRTAVRCSQVEAIAAGVALRHGVAASCALRYAPVVGSHVPSPLGPPAAPPGRARARVRRSAVLAAAPRRRRRARWSPRSSAATTARCNVVGPGAATPWQAARLGGRVPLPVLPRSGTRPRARDRGRGRGDRAARRRAAPPRLHRRRQPRASTRSASPISCRRRQCCASCSSGPTSSRSRPAARRWHEHDLSELGDATTGSTSTASRPTESAVRTRPPPARAAAIRSTRSASIRSSPISSRPSFDAVGPRRRRRRRARPAHGPAVLVANRGFGIVEPAALGVAVRRASRSPAAHRRRARRSRSSAACARRLGAICASGRDVATCAARRSSRRRPARAHVVAHRRRHTAAARCMQAMTLAPIVPVAVTPGGPFGTAIGPWQVRVRPAGHACPTPTTPTTRSRRRASPKRCATRSPTRSSNPDDPTPACVR